MRNKTGKKNHHNRKLRILICFTAAVLAAATLRVLFPSALTTLYAMFDENQAVHIEPDDIENATLAIGTHLIYLGGLDDQIYTLAKESAGDSGQTEMYYKSELGDGAWYAISSAGSLEDITKADARIDNQVIRDLFFTYHTRSDGVTYDLRTNEAVNAFDIMSPYDSDQLPELEELRNQMETLENTGTDIGLLEDFFAEEETEEGKEITRKSENETTKTLDGQMESLYEYKQRLRQAGTSEDKIDMVTKAMEKVDAARRYEADKSIAARLNTLLDQVASSQELSVHSDLVSAIGNCIKEIQNSMDEADAKRLYVENDSDGNGGNGSGSSGNSSSGETSQGSVPAEEYVSAGIDDSALSHVEQELIAGLLDALDNGDEESAESLLDEMTALYSIIDGVSLNPEREKALLDDRLIPAAEQLYEETGSESCRNELEYLQNLRAQLDGTTEGSRELDELYDEKQDLQEQRISALDQNDPAEAKRLEALIEDANERISALEAEGIYSDGSASQNIQDMKEDALAMLSEEAAKESADSRGDDSQDTEENDTEGGTQSFPSDSLDTDRLSADLEGIGALCASRPELASDALTGIYQKLSAIQAMQEEPDAAVEALLDKTEEIMSGNLPLIHGTIDADTIEEALEEVDQASLDSEDARENAAALAGISMFCEQAQLAEDSAPVQLLEGKAQMLSSKEDALVFSNLTARPGSSYAPVDKIAVFGSMRYVWKENQKKAVLAQGGVYDTFTAFSESVGKAKGEQEKMNSPALFQSVIYLPADYVEQEFSYQVYNLSDTGYSVLTDSEIADTASEVCDAILKERRE